MSSYDRRQRSAALTALAAQAGAGIGSGGPMGAWNQNMANMASNTAQAAAEKEAQKEAEKAKKQKIGGSIGGILGGVAGSLIPVAGPIIGPMIGGALGSSGGQLVGGGRVDLGSAALSGGLAGLGGAAGKFLGGAAGAGGTAAQTTTQASGGLAASNATMKAAGTQALSPMSPPLVQTGYTGGGTATPVGGGGLFGRIATPANMAKMSSQFKGSLLMNGLSDATGMDGMFDPSVPTVSTYRRNPKNGMALEPVYPTFYR